MTTCVCVCVVPLRAVSDVVGTHPEAKEHSVSRWLSRNMNVMKSHASNQHEESQVSAPHGVVSNTPLRVVHKSLSGILIVICPGLAPVVRRHMTLDVAGVAAALLSTSRHSEKTEGRCQVLVTNATINCCRTYEDCDCFAS